MELHFFFNNDCIRGGPYSSIPLGSRLKFSVFFTANKLAESEQQEIFCQRKFQYHFISAETVFIAPMIWVVNFGINAYSWGRNMPPDYATPGGYVTGYTFLTMGFDVFDTAVREAPGAPQIIYDWRIDEIYSLELAQNLSCIDRTNYDGAIIMRCTLLN